MNLRKNDFLTIRQVKRYRDIYIDPKVNFQKNVYFAVPNYNLKKPFLIIKSGSFIRSGTVIYLGSKIGENCQIGHNAVIRENNKIGDNVVIGVNTYIGVNNIIGKNVKIHTDVFIESCTIEDNVIIAPHVVFTNDPYPPCKKCVEQIGGAYIKSNVVIGANATILPGITIDSNSIIGAGSVVTKDIPSGVVVAGVPAKIIGMVDDIKHKHKHK